MRDTVTLLVSISFVDLALAGCDPAPADPAGDEGNLSFRLSAAYGAEAVLRDMPLAAEDEATVVVSPLSGEAPRAYESSDPEVLAIESASARMVCSTFTLIPDCDRVPTGDYEIAARTGHPGRATLRAVDTDGTVVDHIEVEVRDVASFHAAHDPPWQIEVGQEPTFEVVPVDEDGDTLWMGSTGSWQGADELVRITSQHRNDAVHAVRVVAVAPGEGTLTVTGPAGVESSFAIVVE